MIGALLVFFLVLFILVIAHECGHFFSARFFGIRVEEFGFGIPPRITGFVRRGTLYSINWLPLGGFVKIFGEEGGESENPESFGAHPIWHRAIVLGAGIGANFLLAWIFFSIIAGFQPYTILNAEDRALRTDASMMVLEVGVDSPASKAGIEPGDVIKGVRTGQTEESFTSIDRFREEMQKNAGGPVSVTISREGQDRAVTITPRVNPPEGQGALGIALGWAAPRAWYYAPLDGAVETYTVAKMTVIGVFQTFYELFRGNTDVPVSGPVGIYKITDQARHQGVLTLLFLMGALSVSLGVFNLLPIPGLDGGRLFFVLIEAVTGKKISAHTSAIVHGTGLVALIALLVFVTGLDIKRFF